MEQIKRSVEYHSPLLGRQCTCSVCWLILRVTKLEGALEHCISQQLDYSAVEEAIKVLRSDK